MTATLEHEVDKQRAQSRSSPKKAGNRHGARAAPPRRRGHRRGVGRHAGERGSGQATRAYLGAPTPTTTRLAKHQLADVEVAEVVYSAQGRLAAAPEGRRLEDTSPKHKRTHRVAHRSSRSSGPGGHKQEATEPQRRYRSPVGWGQGRPPLKSLGRPGKTGSPGRP